MLILTAQNEKKYDSRATLNAIATVTSFVKIDHFQVLNGERGVSRGQSNLLTPVVSRKE
jgi:hypothetical protein